MGYYSKNIHEGSVDVDNAVGIDCGSTGQAEWRGKYWDNCNSINNKIFKKRKQEGNLI